MATNKKMKFVSLNFIFLISFILENIIYKFNWMDLSFLIIFIVIFIRFIFVSHIK
jgi:hypothetical protein